MPHKGESAHFFSRLLPPCILIFRQGSCSLLLSFSLSLSRSYSHLHSGELSRELSSPGAHKLSAFHTSPCPLEKLKHLTRKPMPTPAAVIPTQHLLGREITSAGACVVDAAGTPARRGGGAGSRDGSGLCLFSREAPTHPGLRSHATPRRREGSGASLHRGRPRPQLLLCVPAVSGREGSAPVMVWKRGSERPGELRWGEN